MKKARNAEGTKCEKGMNANSTKGTKRKKVRNGKKGMNGKKLQTRKRYEKNKKSMMQQQKDDVVYKTDNTAGELLSSIRQQHPRRT